MSPSESFQLSIGVTVVVLETIWIYWFMVFTPPFREKFGVKLYLPESLSSGMA